MKYGGYEQAPAIEHGKINSAKLEYFYANQKNKQYNMGALG